MDEVTSGGGSSTKGALNLFGILLLGIAIGAVGYYFYDKRMQTVKEEGAKEALESKSTKK